MSLILTIDEMLQAVQQLDPEASGEFVNRAEDLGTELATFIANKLGVETPGADFDMGSIMAPFRKAYPDQEAPDTLQQLDPGGDWE